MTLLLWIRNLEHTRLASHHQENDPLSRNAEEAACQATEKANQIGQEMFEDSENGRFIDPSLLVNLQKPRNGKGRNQQVASRKR